MFTPKNISEFHRDGYIIACGLAEPSLCTAMRELAEAALAGNVEPVEYEADVHYPGAPASRDAPGGRTVRRLLQAYERNPIFQQWAKNPLVVARLRQLLGPRLVLPQVHHNCIMTKQPRYSSATLWHQDIRYWSFERPELISVWLALGTESPDNGCLSLLPGSHTTRLAPEQLDDALFLRLDATDNQKLLTTQVAAELKAGDVLFFDCRTFHGAQRNQTDQTKFSVVFTYRPVNNRPLLDTRSASMPEIAISS